MIRTQIYLPEGTHRRLKQLAKQRNVAMAHVVRDILNHTLHEKAVHDGGISVLRDVANINAEGGPEDLSTNMDHYLYGSPKKKNSSR